MPPEKKPTSSSQSERSTQKATGRSPAQRPATRKPAAKPAPTRAQPAKAEPAPTRAPQAKVEPAAAEPVVAEAAEPVIAEPAAPAKTSGPIESWLAPRPKRAELSRRLHVLRWHVVLVAAFLVMGLAGAGAYVRVAPKTYQAESDILVTPVDPDDPNLIGLPLVRDTEDPTSDVLTVAKLVTSPPVASLVAKEIGGQPSSLLSHVTATPVTESEIIAVQATASSPAQASRIANAFANQTVQERTNVLHAQLATLIPSLVKSMHSLTATESSALAAQLAVLETLKSAPDPTVRVSSLASNPTAPSSPKTTLSLAAGGFAGLVIGILTVLALQAVDPKLRDEDQLRDLYDLPLLARIPRQRSSKTPITPGELSPQATEAFRTLRSAFMMRHRSGDNGHAVLITGDTAGDGKTTIALNLAAALSAAGKHVILIEADLRRPSIGQALRVTAPKGLASVVFDEIELVDALITTRWHGPQLELLLAGAEAASHVDRISPERARRLVRDARELCDFVIIDSPPLTDITDTLPLADEADDVLLVARVGTSQLRKLTVLGELLIRERIRPAGVAIVCPPESRSSYYYSYQYRSGAPALWGLLKRVDKPAGGNGTALVEANGASLSLEHNGIGLIKRNGSGRH